MAAARSILSLILFLAFIAPTFSAPGDTELISVRRLDLEQNSANRPSTNPSMNPGGRCIAFQSLASDLVGGDTNRLTDIFVYDRTLGAIERVSVDSRGTQATGSSFDAAIGGPAGRYVAYNGRYVTFSSSATNLVAGSSSRGIFVRDLQTGTTTLASIDPNGNSIFGGSDPSLSADGRFVAFAAFDIYVRDRLLGLTTLASVGLNGQPGTSESSVPSISANGRYVVFASLAEVFVANDTNGARDIFLRDRRKEVTTLISVDSSGAQTPFGRESTQPSISGDGHSIVFTSQAASLVADDVNESHDVFLHER
jgi:Tol biopolymer transport system component